MKPRLITDSCDKQGPKECETVVFAAYSVGLTALSCDRCLNERSKYSKCPQGSYWYRWFEIQLSDSIVAENI